MRWRIWSRFGRFACPRPFGRPSDAVILGTLSGRRVAFLPRHGRGHRINPSMINYRANVYALKSLGVTRIISVSAVGSMKTHIRPGHLVLPAQFIDRTTRRVSTFFDQGLVAHVAFADPVCPIASVGLGEAAKTVGGHRPRGGNLSLHGRAAVFDSRRILVVSAMGGGRDRDDKRDGSQTREGGRNLFCDHGTRHGL